MCIGRSVSIIYLGNNDPRKYKRGVENVIYAQSHCLSFRYKYYVFWGECMELFRWDDIICISIPNHSIFLYNYIIFKIKRYHKHTIIHSHGPVRTLLSIFPSDILTVHDAIYYQRKGLGQKQAWRFILVEKLAYLHSKYLHFISYYSKANSLVSPSRKRVDVIYNTTPLELMNIYYMPQKHSNTITLFTVRGIQERTRIDLLIDFAKYVRNKRINGKNIKIEVAGKGVLLDYFNTIIKNDSLANINLLGYISDEEVIRKYMDADVVIVTCEHAEGFGLPIIEGYLFNKPVIASNKCAIPEIIIDSSFLFENDPESIYETLVRSLNCKYSYKRYYDEYYSINAFRHNMEKYYKKVISDI